MKGIQILFAFLLPVAVIGVPPPLNGGLDDESALAEALRLSSLDTTRSANVAQSYNGAFSEDAAVAEASRQSLRFRNSGAVQDVNGNHDDDSALSEALRRSQRSQEPSSGTGSSNNPPRSHIRNLPTATARADAFIREFEAIARRRHLPASSEAQSWYSEMRRRAEAVSHVIRAADRAIDELQASPSDNGLMSVYMGSQLLLSSLRVSENAEQFKRILTTIFEYSPMDTYDGLRDAIQSMFDELESTARTIVQEARIYTAHTEGSQIHHPSQQSEGSGNSQDALISVPEGTRFECSVCLSSESDGGCDPVQIRRCRHIFCRACIQQVRRMGGSCPNCRGPIE
jgi:hypothetical protein